jgi:hypothetical protein
MESAEQAHKLGNGKVSSGRAQVLEPPAAKLHVSIAEDAEQWIQQSKPEQ